MKLVWDLLYCMRPKPGNWQADWWMFYADVIAGCRDTWQEFWDGKTGGLAVRWQRCVELKTFLLSWGTEDRDGLNMWKGQWGLCWVRWEFGGDSRQEGLGISGVIVWWRIWTWCRINGCGGHLSPIQSHPRWENVDILKTRMMMMNFITEREKEYRWTDGHLSKIVLTFHSISVPDICWVKMLGVFDMTIKQCCKWVISCWVIVGWNLILNKIQPNFRLFFLSCLFDNKSPGWPFIL